MSGDTKHFSAAPVREVVTEGQQTSGMAVCDHFWIQAPPYWIWACMRTILDASIHALASKMAEAHANQRLWAAWAQSFNPQDIAAVFAVLHPQCLVACAGQFYLVNSGS